MRIEESLNVTFDESLPEPKSSPSVKDDRIIEPVVQNQVMSNVSELGCPKSLKEARGHPIEQVIDQQIRRIHQLDTTYRPFYSEHRIESYSLNGIFVHLNNTAYSV
ncbi:hypothetical protein Tco_0677360 [Tanacetum coccineum]|uniref:Uncharacterized protein n=1 Tax=Tanacetum coccineum TaxID=301880 RepID=A0ABQ4XC69_9ASTR